MLHLYYSSCIINKNKNLQTHFCVKRGATFFADGLKLWKTIFFFQIPSPQAPLVGSDSGSGSDGDTSMVSNGEPGNLDKNKNIT